MDIKKVEKIMKKHCETTKFFEIEINDLKIDCSNYEIIERINGDKVLVIYMCEHISGRIEISKIKKIESKA